MAKVLSPWLLGAALCVPVALGGVALAKQTRSLEPDASALEVLERRSELERTFEKLAKSPYRLEKFRQEGRLHTALCKHCHGEHGISETPGVPTLAGQNPVYLVDQFERFAAGWRQDFLMEGLARMLSEDQKIKLAAYYASLPSPGGAGNGLAARRAHGAAIYRSDCQECHGPYGRGDSGYAHLAGQRADYVVKMLREFRNPTGKRPNPWMSAVAVGLSDEDIVALAAYVAGLE